MLCFERESFIFVSTQFARVLITIIIIAINGENASTFPYIYHFFTILLQIALTQTKKIDTTPLDDVYLFLF